MLFIKKIHLQELLSPTPPQEPIFLKEFIISISLNPPLRLPTDRFFSVTQHLFSPQPDHKNNNKKKTKL